MSPPSMPGGVENPITEEMLTKIAEKLAEILLDLPDAFREERNNILWEMWVNATYTDEVYGDKLVWAEYPGNELAVCKLVLKLVCSSVLKDLLCEVIHEIVDPEIDEKLAPTPEMARAPAKKLADKAIERAVEEAVDRAAKKISMALESEGGDKAALTVKVEFTEEQKSMKPMKKAFSNLKTKGTKKM